MTSHRTPLLVRAPRPRLSRAAVLAVASLGLLAGCWTQDTASEGSPSAAASQPAASQSAASESASAQPAPSAVATPEAACPAGTKDQKSYECLGVTVTGAAGEEPTIDLGDLGPAEALGVADVYVGSGAALAPGDTVTFNYVGMGQQSKQVFDSSWTRGQPLTYPIDGLIQGWQQGMVGMQPGGRRLLVIPGDLGYGPAGTSDGAIAPDETLVFVVDLVEISPS